MDSHVQHMGELRNAYKIVSEDLKERTSYETEA
jgi:hypothetical protein